MTTQPPVANWPVWLARRDVSREDKAARLVEYVEAHGALPTGCDFLWSETSKLVSSGHGSYALLPQLFPQLNPNQLALLLRTAPEANARVLFVGLITGSTRDAALKPVLSAFVRVVDEERLCALIRSLGQLAGRYPADEPILGQRFSSVLRKLPQDPALFLPRLAALRAVARCIPQGDERVRAWWEFHESFERFVKACRQKASTLPASGLGTEREQALQPLLADLSRAMPGDLYADDRQGSSKRQLLAGLVAAARLPDDGLPKDFEQKAAGYFQAGQGGVVPPPPQPKPVPLPSVPKSTSGASLLTPPSPDASGSTGVVDAPRRRKHPLRVFAMATVAVVLLVLVWEHADQLMSRVRDVRNFYAGGQRTSAPDDTPDASREGNSPPPNEMLAPSEMPPPSESSPPGESSPQAGESEKIEASIASDSSPPEAAQPAQKPVASALPLPPTPAPPVSGPLAAPHGAGAPSPPKASPAPPVRKVPSAAKSRAELPPLILKNGIEQADRAKPPRSPFADEPMQEFAPIPSRPTAVKLCELEPTQTALTLRLHGRDVLTGPYAMPVQGAGSESIEVTKTEFTPLDQHANQYSVRVGTDKQSESEHPIATFSIRDRAIWLEPLRCELPFLNETQSRLRFCVLEIKDEKQNRSRFVALQKPRRGVIALTFDKTTGRSGAAFRAEATMVPSGDSLFLGSGRVNVNGAGCEFGGDFATLSPTDAWPLVGLSDKAEVLSALAGQLGCQDLQIRIAIRRQQGRAYGLVIETEPDLGQVGVPLVEGLKGKIAALETWKDRLPPEPSTPGELTRQYEAEYMEFLENAGKRTDEERLAWAREAAAALGLELPRGLNPKSRDFAAWVFQTIHVGNVGTAEVVMKSQLKTATMYKGLLRGTCLLVFRSLASVEANLYRVVDVPGAGDVGKVCVLVIGQP